MNTIEIYTELGRQLAVSMRSRGRLRGWFAWLWCYSFLYLRWPWFRLKFLLSYHQMYTVDPKATIAAAERYADNLVVTKVLEILQWLDRGKPRRRK